MHHEMKDMARVLVGKTAIALVLTTVTEAVTTVVKKTTTKMMMMVIESVIVGPHRRCEELDVHLRRRLFALEVDVVVGPLVVGVVVESYAVQSMSTITSHSSCYGCCLVIVYGTVTLGDCTS